MHPQPGQVNCGSYLCDFRRVGLLGWEENVFRVGAVPPRDEWATKLVVTRRTRQHHFDAEVGRGRRGVEF